jgi:hypothetical protein
MGRQKEHGTFWTAMKIDEFIEKKAEFDRIKSMTKQQKEEYNKNKKVSSDTLYLYLNKK